MSSLFLSSTRSWQQRLLAGVDYALLGLLCIAPLCMGGRHPVGRFVVIAMVLFMATCWLIRQCLEKRGNWQTSSFDWLLLAGALIVSVQMVPLPTGWLHWISPSLADRLPLWSTSEESIQLGIWNQISLTPESTRCGLVTYITYALLFVVVSQRIRELADVKRILKWIGTATAGMALLGLAQYFVGNGKFLWIYEHPFRSTDLAVKGCFINENHFAHFLALGIGPLFYWNWLHSPEGSRSGRRQFAAGQEFVARQETVRPGMRTALAIALGLVCFAVLLTYSRGGVIVMLVTLVAVMAVYARRSLIGKTTVVKSTAAGAVVITALILHGYRPLLQQLATMRTASINELSNSVGRLHIWKADLASVQESPWLGSGVGSHREVYRTFYSRPSSFEFTHAECGFLHVLVEVGIVGLVLVVIAAGTCSYWCMRTLWVRRTPSTTACSGAVAASLLASFTHSIVDFVWFIPACMTLTVVLMAVAYRLYRFEALQDESGTSGISLTRGCWIGVLASLLIVGSMMLAHSSQIALASLSWDRYLRLSKADDAAGPVPWIPGKDAEELDRSKKFRVDTAYMACELEQVLAIHPYDARANARMATILLRQFEIAQQSAENSMSLAAIRDAALTSGFSSRRELEEWLERAIGNNRQYLDQAWHYALRALYLCPYQGDLYIHLADLSFLHGVAANTKQSFINQALKVRPNSGAVLFSAGQEAALAGDLARTFDYWKRSFHQGPEQQQAIIKLLGNQLPVDVLLTHLEPDLDGLAKFYSHYAKTNRDDQLAALAPYYSSALRARADTLEGDHAAQVWTTAYVIHRRTGNSAEAVECLRRCVSATPAHFTRRRTLALYLAELGRHEESIEQIEWCLRRRPDNSALLRLLQRARQSSAAVNVRNATREKTDGRQR